MKLFFLRNLCYFGSRQECENLSGVHLKAIDFQIPSNIKIIHLKTIKMKKLLLSTIMLVCVSTMANAQAITVYWDANYSGATKQFSESVSWIGNEWNDKISSIKVPRGWKIEVFQDANYGGASKIIESDWTVTNYDLSWNDKISSIKILRKEEVNNGITVYWDANFSGATKQFSESVPWVGNDWNDKISSIRIPYGWKIQVFQDANYGGASKYLESDWTVTGYDREWNDKISSIKIIAAPGHNRSHIEDPRHAVPPPNVSEPQRQPANEPGRDKPMLNSSHADNLYQNSRPQADNQSNGRGGNDAVRPTEAKRIIYTGGNVRGAFTHKNGGDWYNSSNEGTEDYFEIKRDEWSIYLKSNSGKTYQLDLFQKKVYLDPFGRNRREVYTIAEVEKQLRR